MLSRWFGKKNRLDHRDPAVRLQAIEALDPQQASQAQVTLELMAVKDPDRKVQHAAICAVENPDVLTPLLDEPELVELVAGQIAKRIKDGRSATCNNHPRVVRARIDQAEPEDLDALWPYLDTPTQCATLAVRLRDEARERVLAHPQLQSEAGLTELLHCARGRDKACHRHARDQLDTLKQARAKATKHQARLVELDNAISKALKAQADQTTQNPATQDLRQQSLVHHQKLTKLAEMRANVAEDLQTAIDQLANYQAADGYTLPTNPLKGVDLTPIEPAADPFPPLVDALEQLSTQMRNGHALDLVGPEHNRLSQAWLSHADRYPPNAAQHQCFASVSKQYAQYSDAWQKLAAIQGWRDHLPANLAASDTYGPELKTATQERQKWRKRWHKPIKNLQWPQAHEVPSELLEATDSLTRIEAEIEVIDGLYKRAGESLSSALAAANSALENGQLEETQRQLRSARQLQKDGIHSFDRELAALSAKVAEFRDWRQFATSPKRQGLIEDIQKLCDEPLDPPAQAARLKHLRQQWRELGRPASAAEAQLQSQFDELADTAFAPCRDYFAQQAEIRADNLAKREALCEQLDAYISSTDWQTADMRAADTILRQAREEWRNYHPCERQALKPVQSRFEALQDTLYGKLKAAWDANVAAKQDIVSAAKALLEQGSEIDGQVDAVKRLQQQWQSIGATPRGPDQRLWREFRQTCDAIFGQRDAHKEAAKLELDQRYQLLQQAIDELTQAINNEPVSRKTYDQLNQAIDNAAAGLSLNTGHRKAIDAAQSAYERALDLEDRKQAQAELQQWQAWDAQVTAAELTHQDIPSPHPIFADRAKGTASPADWLNLVLQAEIAAEIASPAEDQAARMALQIEFMNAGIRDLAAEDYRLLLQRWCSAGPKDSIADGLRERFFKALAGRC